MKNKTICWDKPFSLVSIYFYLWLKEKKNLFLLEKSLIISWHNRTCTKTLKNLYNYLKSFLVNQRLSLLATPWRLSLSPNYLTAQVIFFFFFLKTVWTSLDYIIQIFLEIKNMYKVMSVFALIFFLFFKTNPALTFNSNFFPSLNTITKNCKWL